MKVLTIILMLVLILFPGKMPCYGQSNYEMAADYSFIISGSSNIRDWMESADDADGIASITRIDDLHFDINEVRILIRTNAIKSIGVEGNAMNKKTYETLKTDRYPTIIFMITSPVRPVVADGKKRFIEAAGMLTVAGVTKVIRIHPTIWADQQGRITTEGDVFLKMSDFAIDPPTTLFGLLNVRDDITVHFKMSLVPADNY